ncbi:hypothetical protein ATO7_09712 [Oceanococcus atlanticus]|uniref:Lipoprotein n=1 Tax=Oceanococcus atlanticus TaxID=1317117 RepID=A0A1Y1SE91_9GAMM|nr:hypothetical protein [Oceanococcus atlanticus]ORE87308.1 hypothetical protein ATO7_09712 [Oceanococcus atlanticus]
MKQHSNLRDLSLALTAASALAACGGSGGGGGGGGGVNSDTKAALAGVAALSLAQTGISMADQAEEDQQMAKASQTEQCDSGSLTTTDETGPGPSGNQASPYHSGDFTKSRIEADNCRLSSSEGGFSFESFTDGDIEFGDAASETVSYIVADNYVSQMSGSFFGAIDMAMDGTMHLCDGCANPEDAESDIEIKAFMNMDMTFDGQRFIMTMGSSLSDMLSMSSAGETGGTGTHVINGRMKSEVVGTSCSFDATYETIQPMVTSNTYTENETVVSGDFQITIAGSGSHRVVISNGVVSVDGVVFSEEELAAIEDDCDFGMEE